MQSFQLISKGRKLGKTPVLDDISRLDVKSEYDSLSSSRKRI